MDKNLHDEIAAASSSPEFDVRPAPDDPPEVAAGKLAKILIGDGAESRPGDTEADPEELERRIFSKGRQRCRVFHLNDNAQADAFANLIQEAEVKRTVYFIGKARDMVDGIQHAVSVRWVEFDEPYEKIAEEVKKSLDFSDPEKKSILTRLFDKSEKDDGVRCMGTTAKGTQCSRKRVIGTRYCRIHDKPEVAVEMDAPPVSHTGLST